MVRLKEKSRWALGRTNSKTKQMVSVHKLGILLHKTTHNFENEGVLNPAVIKVGDTIHLFYRAVTKDNYSTIGYCELSDPLTVKSRHETPLLVPQYPYEFQGLEDPRIVEIEGTYYLSYTAFDGINALGTLATSTDLVHWKKKAFLCPKLLTKSLFILPKPMGRYTKNTFDSMNTKKATKSKTEKSFCGIRT